MQTEVCAWVEEQLLRRPMLLADLCKLRTDLTYETILEAMDYLYLQGRIVYVAGVAQRVVPGVAVEGHTNAVAIMRTLVEWPRSIQEIAWVTRLSHRHISRVLDDLAPARVQVFLENDREKYMLTGWSADVSVSVTDDGAVVFSYPSQEQVSDEESPLVDDDGNKLVFVNVAVLLEQVLERRASC